MALDIPLRKTNTGQQALSSAHITKTCFQRGFELFIFKTIHL